MYFVSACGPVRKRRETLPRRSTNGGLVKRLPVRPLARMRSSPLGLSERFGRRFALLGGFLGGFSW